ncbi:helix-turn-helix transcriptional regulator [Serratia sp. JUb9]|uniref:helix-turn-helix domain-containing protein n=1 Tax=unclassified Serratia (in: enterobacteria) TaxID=2647522 RepID=UPI000CF72D0D|nr:MULTISPECIES: helix-turn-helix transcriptional regulator [unclassified Serratia (in: enterobacteria)]MBU3893273.1 helix-turn-helix domain-containing protein [Serratia rubidaea]AVJ19222.1 transcriptional regulator [Serratia sp. MYb239]QNK33170.1 helix-turn-helix transcriptional regulator [Serratia sp. JUb9]QPT13447.1 helix-turn-helix transcriptional regulator [Serratia rubidaea]CAE1149976.1 HTH cro/C1-type domain-containing protein [Serratia sp. Tan611]
MFGAEKSSLLRANLEHLLRSKGETQVSVSESTGLNRTTIFKILDGRVASVQKQTLRKISDFFGVTMYELQHVDIATAEKIDASISVHGNMNAAALPIIPLTSLIEQINAGRSVGELTLSWPLTYYYGHGPNLIAVAMDKNPPVRYRCGDMLIIRKGIYKSTNLKLLFKSNAGFFTDALACVDEVDAGVIVLGDILEERYGN